MKPQPPALITGTGYLEVCFMLEIDFLGDGWPALIEIYALCACLLTIGLTDFCEIPKVWLAAF